MKQACINKPPTPHRPLRAISETGFARTRLFIIFYIMHCSFPSLLMEMQELDIPKLLEMAGGRKNHMRGCIHSELERSLKTMVFLTFCQNNGKSSRN